MARVHEQNGVSFSVYNVGLVGSAANYIFLNAQHRYSQDRGTFLFHAAWFASNTPSTAEKLREATSKLDDYERVMRATLKAHSRLTDEEATIYLRRTVVLNADDARRDGIIDAIAAYPAPPGKPLLTISMKPNPASAPKPPAGPSS